MAANYTCGMEIVLDHGGLTAATVAARLQEEFQQRNVSSADFFLDRRPIDNWQLSRQVGISKDFCLTSQYMEVRLMSVANFGIDIIYITSIPGTAISMSDWAASFFGDFFIMAYVFDVNYQYWQNAQDPLQYSARGKDYSALPMISNGMPPPLEQMIIDTSRNPGRRILCEGYIEAVGATMWLGEVFWSRTHADRNALDQKHLTCNCSPLAAFRSGGWGTWRWGQDGAEAGEWALSGDAAGRDNGAEIGVGFRAPA